jgi:redox-sensitive bicupin YhaK (pirin superfamily)
MKTKKVVKKLEARPATDGAGVKLRRVFGYHELPEFDPFLMLDHFGSDDPDEYMAGFPWHPHRGIETVTYMLKGSIEHGDSMGNSGIIKEGDVQWMTAGGGIIHQEMPKNSPEGLEGFQLWVNLPAKDKMMNPRYREIKSSEIPEVYVKDEISVKVIAGRYMESEGPVKDLIVDCKYLDINFKQNSIFTYNIPENKKTVIYVYAGEINVPEEILTISKYWTVILDKGNIVEVKGKKGTGILLFSGEPIKEEIFWGGPIVMSTKKDLQKAFEDYNNGTFVKKPDNK